MKIIKNRQNLYTLLRYRKKAISKLEKDTMVNLIDAFSRDFNILNKILEIKTLNSFLECLLIDLEIK